MRIQSELLIANSRLRKKWRVFVDEPLGSGLTAIRWVKEHGVSAKQLHRWIAEFRYEDALSAGQTRRLQLETVESHVSTGAFEAIDACTICLPHRLCSV